MDYSKSELKKSGSGLKSRSSNVVDCSILHCYDRAPTDSAGAISVFFWRWSTEYQYEWHMMADARKYSVFIDHDKVRNRSAVIREVLERISAEEIRRMREAIGKFLPKLLYAKSGTDLGSIDDAFDVTMEEVGWRWWLWVGIEGVDGGGIEGVEGRMKKKREKRRIGKKDEDFDLLMWHPRCRVGPKKN